MNNTIPTEHSDAQNTLNQIVIEYLREQKRKRRWRWVNRMVILALLAFLFYLLFTLNAEEKTLRIKPHVGLIDIKGNIADEQNASAAHLSKGLKEAYESEGLKAVIIRINSPGGSPVQADEMYGTLRYYQQKYPNIKLYAVCTDMCTSAAYYVAAAASEVYANPSSLVGSIGVLYNGFGFVDTLQKLGVARRLQTAGAYKGFLDPFSAVMPGQTQRVQIMLDDIHQIFIDKVKEGRGSRLKTDELTFSGLFWTGGQAKERGFIDGFASSEQIARDMLQLEEIIDYTYKPSAFERMAKNIGTAMVNELPKAFGLNAGVKALSFG